MMGKHCVCCEVGTVLVIILKTFSPKRVTFEFSIRTFTSLRVAKLFAHPQFNLDPESIDGILL